MGKKLKWNLVLMSILYLGLGIFLLLVPGTAMNIVCYALGGVVLACAAVQLVRYFAVERGVFQSQLTLISGLVCLGLGAFLIIRSDIVVRILPIVFGLFVIFDSLGRIQNALELRKCQYPSWKGFLLLAVLSIVLGIVIAYLTNYWIVGIPHDWQWMLGIEAVPALAFGLLLMTVPESPRWLLIRSRDAEARRVLERTTRENVEAEMAEIRASLAGAGDTGERLFRKKYFIPILLAFLISTFNQLTGINAILYYAPRLFEMSGVFREGAMMQSIMIGITNLTFTMLGMFLIDKVGRKKLIGVGAVGMFVSLVLVARGFWLERFEGYYMLVCLMGYIAFFAVSLGATIWVVISEVFPNSVRAKGQVLGSMTHWVWSALLSWFFPVFLSVGGTYIFGFFALIALGSLIFAIKLPETKDKSLEQIQKELVK